MEDDLEILEEKQHDLQEKIEKVNDVIQSLQASNQKLSRKIEKAEEANQNLQEENENLHHKIIKTQKSLSKLKQSPESKQMRIRRSLTMAVPIVIEIQPTSSEESDDADDIISDDPNLELFIKQIHEVKSLCKEQNELLLKFQETMSSTREDTEKLQTVLAEIEHEKKGVSEIFGNVEAKQFQLLDFYGKGREAESMESSMFISALYDGEIGNRHSWQKCDEQLKLYKPSFTFVKRVLFYSHIPALKL